MQLFMTPKKLYKELERRYAGKDSRILDVGVGRRKFPGSVGVDVRPHASCDIVHDLNS